MIWHFIAQSIRSIFKVLGIYTFRNTPNNPKFIRPICTNYLGYFKKKSLHHNSIVHEHVHWQKSIFAEVIFNIHTREWLTCFLMKSRRVHFNRHAQLEKILGFRVARWIFKLRSWIWINRCLKIQKWLMICYR